MANRIFPAKANEPRDLNARLDRSSPAFLEGRLAYHSGTPKTACPFRIGQTFRREWLAGWYDARCATVHAGVWRKYGIDW